MHAFHFSSPSAAAARFLLVLILAGTLSAQADRAQITLGNGLRVLALHLPHAELVSLALVFPGGARIERPGQEGWVHLMEHMVWRGHEGTPSQAAFMARGNRIGALHHSLTEAEWLILMLTADDDSLRPALEYLLDVVRMPLFSPVEVDREKQVVLQELDRLAASVPVQLENALEVLLTRRRTAAVLGDPDAILNATSEQLRLLKLRQLLPNNAALVVAGPLPPNKVLDRIRLTMGQWAMGFPSEVTINAQGSPARSGGRDSVLVLPVRNAHWSLAWPGPGSDDGEATGAGQLLAGILAHPAGPFQRSLVNRGDVLSLEVEYRQRADGGSLVLRLVMPLERVAAVQGALRAELQRLANPVYLSPADVRNAKASLRARRELAQSRPWEIALAAARAWAARGLTRRSPTGAPPDAATQQMVFEFLRTYVTGQTPASVLVVDNVTRRNLGLNPARLP